MKFARLKVVYFLTVSIFLTLFINNTLQPNKLKIRTAMNAKISVLFVLKRSYICYCIICITSLTNFMQLSSFYTPWKKAVQFCYALRSYRTRPASSYGFTVLLAWEVGSGIGHTHMSLCCNIYMNLFQTNVLFYTPENIPRFFYVFRGCCDGTLTWSGLIR